MDGNKQLEVMADISDEEYSSTFQDNEALFGPLARKTMTAIALILLIVIGIAAIVSHPLTILPFVICVFSIYFYRNMSKNFYRQNK